jgi:hypothetical protein
MNGAKVVSGATVGTVADASWRIVEVADFDGDGKADILWRNTTTGADTVWFMNGAAIAGSAAPNAAAGLGWSVMPASN